MTDKIKRLAQIFLDNPDIQVVQIPGGRGHRERPDTVVMRAEGNGPDEHRCHESELTELTE